MCSGAFVLGDAGLLDDRECTTHWRYTDQLAARFPAARVVPEVLYVDAGQVVTSAGTAAGLDACLHLWRQEYGAAAASKVARRMVVPPQREGGQAQFIRTPVPDCDAETLGPLLSWVDGAPRRGRTRVESLARACARCRRAPSPGGSAPRPARPRTRGSPPAGAARRGAAGDQRPQRSSWIADEVGFGNAATLRHHFNRARAVSPQQYRRTFSAAG